MLENFFKPILGLLGGIGNTLLGGFMQSSAQTQSKEDTKELMDYQAAIQDRQQDKLFNQYNKQIPQQVASMRDAGLNPAFSHGSFDAQVQTAPMPSASQSTAPFPNVDIFSGLSQLANAQLMEKQGNYYDSLSKKTEQETLNIGEDTNTKRINNQYLAQNWMAQIVNSLSSASANRSVSALNFHKIPEIQANITKISKEVDEIQSKINLNRSNEKYMNSMAEYYNKQSSTWNSYINSIIKKNFADASLSFGKNSREQQMLLYDIFNADAMANYYMSQSSLNDMMRKLQDVELKMQKRYGDVQRITGIINNVVGSIGSAVGGAAGAFFGARGVLGKVKY